MSYRKFIHIIQYIIFGTLVSAFSLPASAEDEVVNVYSARKEALIQPILDQFSKKYEIQVNLVTGKADALIQRLNSEGEFSPADVLITTDAGRLHRAKDIDVIQPVKSSKLESLVPANFRDQKGYWYGLSVRARTIVFNPKKVRPGELSTYEALTDKKWNKRICVRSSNNIYNQSLVASMIVHFGKEKTEAWAHDFVKNFARKPQGGDRDQIKAVSAGQCDIALVNTYYLGKMLLDENQSSAASAVTVFWPNQNDRGVHVNVSGAAVTAASKNKHAAIRLIEFLASDEAQKWYAENNQEYPIRDGIEVSPILQNWGTFKADSLSLHELGERNADAVRVMDRAGWK